MSRRNKELKDMAPQEREERLKDLYLELMRLRAQGVTENTKAIRDIRRQIARIKTLQGG
ncbi:MAG: 50S ribosomal protein L29, partial [Candidatus Bathyarchaeia archaeon]